MYPIKYKITRRRKESYGILIICVICIIALFSCNPNRVRKEANLPKLPFNYKLQKTIDRIIETNKKNNYLGISAAVIVSGYKPWVGVCGMSHPNTPITIDMMFDAGSIMKNFESALVIKLAEEGKLTLDTPVSKYLPSLQNVDKMITIRQLLNHTSGVFNVFENPNFPWVQPGIDYSKKWDLKEVFRTFVLHPYGPPGYTQHYSSTNYLLVTAIIDKIVDSSINNEISKHFLKPLNLEHTYISMGELPPPNYSVAHPWVDLDKDGKLEDLYGLPLVWKVTLTHPVILSTAGDLAAWMHYLYNERIVLRKSSLEEMLTYPEVLVQDPEGDIYGLGVVDFSKKLSLKALGHGGSALGYSAAALYLPEYSTSIAWLINTGESPRNLADKLMKDTWNGLFEVLKTNMHPL